MKRREEKKKVGTPKKKGFFKSTLGLGIICAIASVVMLARGVAVQPDINENKKAAAELDAQIAQEKERQAQVDKMRENSDSDEYIEKIARERLGMVKNDEIVFIDVSEK